MNNKIRVSVFLFTYNHEKYIEKALDSILSQKTDFKYEIIIRDGGSSDNTYRIIKDYQKRYPDIITVVMKAKDKRTAKSRMLQEVVPVSKGKYTAIIEGDDYWTDVYKLQKQFDFMEKHPDYSLVVTNYGVLNDITGKVRKTHFKDKDYSVSEIILSNEEAFATSSMFAIIEYAYHTDSFYNISPFEDYVTLLQLSLQGKVYFMKDCTSVYRINAVGSWTTNLKKGDVVSKRWYLYNELSSMFSEFNKNTNYKYDKEIEYLLLKKEFIIYTLDNNTLMMKHDKFKKLYKMGNIKSRFSYFIKTHFSKLYIYLRNIKHKVEKY